jgi:hypothetical protein
MSLVLLSRFQWNFLYKTVVVHCSELQRLCHTKGRDEFRFLYGKIIYSSKAYYAVTRGGTRWRSG